ncbi:MAG TPA: hypothetical protein DCR35_20300 [Runella sp.]|nr:hypothetical protein [Runella sp.]
MRKVAKDLQNIPASLSQHNTENHLNAIQINKKLIDSDVYRGKIKDEDGNVVREEVVEALEAIYYNKCAYCEQPTHTYIEHYRPKNRVIKSPNHGGYFWLCYEWSNLLPTCHECNKIGGGKGDQFPIQNEAQRARFADCYLDNQIDFTKLLANQPPLIDEAPYLLHPEIDDPREYLSFEIDAKKRGIALKGIDEVTKRGEETIRICHLNRVELLLKRQETIIKPVIDNIRRAFGLLSKGTITAPQFFDELTEILDDLALNSQDPKLSFTLLRETIADNKNDFVALVASQLENSQQEIVLAFLNNYPFNN